MPRSSVTSTSQHSDAPAGRESLTRASVLSSRPRAAPPSTHPAGQDPGPSPPQTACRSGHDSRPSVQRAPGDRHGTVPLPVAAFPSPHGRGGRCRRHAGRRHADCSPSSGGTAPRRPSGTSAPARTSGRPHRPHEATADDRRERPPGAPRPRAGRRRPTEEAARLRTIAEADGPWKRFGTPEERTRPVLRPTCGVTVEKHAVRRASAVAQALCAKWIPHRVGRIPSRQRFSPIGEAVAVAVAVGGGAEGGFHVLEAGEPVVTSARWLGHSSPRRSRWLLCSLHAGDRRGGRGR
ncbi:hypothetical protein SHIRM173S_11188 [Streptomyces hirsutus]